MVVGGMAGVGERTYQILPLRFAGALHAPPLGTFGEVSLEDLAGLSATEGRTRAGSLRGAQLGRLAPPHYAGHDGARVFDSRNTATKKKLLAGPCHGRAVRFSTCLLPGAASASTAEARSSARALLNT